MQLDTLISPNVMQVPLTATTREEAIRELVGLLADQGLVENADAAFATAWAREQERTTGIGEGLAVPHGRCDCIDRVVMAVGKAESPIDFQSFDQKPVRLVVLVLSPPNETAAHIQVLGGISRIMSDRIRREAAFAAATPEELAATLQGNEAR